jgi:hypothetical protein
MIATFGVTSQLTEEVSPQSIPIVVTPTAPSPAPQNIPVDIVENIFPAGSAKTVTLNYTYGGIGPLPVVMSIVSSNGGADQWMGTIPGWPEPLGLILYSITIDDYYSQSFTDPVSGSYTYQESATWPP